ncbi:MAG: phospho-N-acetylmuramoyl-pentapeptide-transferase [Proteobacteria bacterium]|nr:phospho-N-acetylmuramoyl-pentapeptide-transferase [Pseudomonadota bacterium]
MHSPLTAMQITVIVVGAFALVALLGLPAIRILRKVGARQRVRDDGPQRHLGKAGTPTMGGVLIIGAALLVAAGGEWWVGGRLGLPMITLLAVTAAFASIGLVDDWRMISRGRSLGLRARDKLLLQLVVSVAFVYALTGERALAAIISDHADITLPGPAWTVFWVIAIAATSNAVNLADGLDGLATGLCAIAAAGFAVLGLLLGDQQTAVLALALSGACVAFLVFNLHPAKVFMGDVGSLALGGALGAMAARLGQPVVLLGLCLIPFIEELSVIAQVISFKTTGKRVFKMSPLHHHFELSGWSEPRVVAIFWAVGAIAAVVVVAIVMAQL